MFLELSKLCFGLFLENLGKRSMKQRITLILIILGLSLGFISFFIQNEARAEKISFVSTNFGSDMIYAKTAAGSNQMRLSVNETSAANLWRINQADDFDGDGVPDFRDNCPTKSNPEKIAFTSNRDSINTKIFVMNADGTNQVRVTNNPPNDFSPSFSPNGSKIAFAISQQGFEIYVINIDGSNQTRLTNNPLLDEDPSFSPDGSKIAFRSNRDGDAEIYLMNSDGSNQINLTNNPADDIQPAFSPDGSKIAFVSYRDGIPEIYVMNSDGSNQINLTNNPSFDLAPAFSPDGSEIAFSSNRDGNAEIYLMNSDGTNPTRLTNNPASDFHPSFSTDGSKIAFSSNRDGNNEIYLMNSNGSNQINLTNNPAEDFEPSWGRQADSDGDGIGDACENPSPNRNRLFNFSSLLRQSSYFIEVDAGSSVAVSFSLNGFEGLDIYTAPPTSQQISCFDKSPLGQLQPIQIFPPDVTYNSTFDLYITTWRTEAEWAGTCRRLILMLKDGTTKTMDYRFR